MPEEVITQELSAGEPTIVVTHLVEAALEGGAPDNVTVVVADVVEVPDEAPLDNALPVVVGAVGEPRNRERLPNVPWPADEQFDPESDGARGPTLGHRSSESGRAQRGGSRTARCGATPGSCSRSGRSRWCAVISGAVLYWVSTQWFVGESDGNVAIYQGVPSEIGPIPLNRISQETAIAVADLPTYDQERVQQSIMVDSQEQAINTVAQLDQRAQECTSDAPPAGCPAGAAAGARDVAGCRRRRRPRHERRHDRPDPAGHR